MNKRLAENCLTLRSASEINQLLTPLTPFGINFFTYVKVFKDNSRLTLSNHANWAQFFFERFYSHAYDDGEIFEKTEQQFQFNLWLASPQNKSIRDNREVFNLANGIDVQRSDSECSEFFVFAGDAENTAINNFYINHFDLLKKFILYFKDRAKPLIDSAKISDRVIYQSNKKVEVPDVLDDVKNTFHKSTKIKRYPVSIDTQNTYLTQREIDCLELLSKGLKAKEIALVLNIAPRTVESHLDSCRLKLQGDHQLSLAMLNFKRNLFFERD